METTLENIKSAVCNLWKRVQGSPSELPGAFAIDPSHTDQMELLVSEFQTDGHYFQVRVNELYLPYDRQWFVDYEPLVFAVTECTYDGKPLAIPTMVGPQMMPKLPSGELPERMQFLNTRVAGLYPYRGGRLTLTIVLYRSKRKDVAQRLLKFIETTANALSFATVVEMYLKVANVVVSGLEELAGLGNLDPLLGIRREFDPDAGDPFTPGYFVLTQTANLDVSKLWVKGGQLLSGDTMANAQPFRDAAYALYSIMPTTKRSDVNSLPIYDLYKEAKKMAALPGDKNWDVAKANLSALYQLMVTSPDLLADHVGKLTEDYIAELTKIHAQADKIRSLDMTKRSTTTSKAEGIGSLDMTKRSTTTAKAEGIGSQDMIKRSTTTAKAYSILKLKAAPADTCQD
jgi:hypothetical protein